MKFSIEHEIKGRMRVKMYQYRMSYEQADILDYYLNHLPFTTEVSVNERTCCAIIKYTGDRTCLINALRSFHYEDTEVPAQALELSSRKDNAKYKEALVTKVVCRYLRKMYLPMPVRAVLTSIKSVKYICKGLKCLMQRKIEVPVLDAVAIGASVFRQDFETAGSVMFLLGIGEILEEWTHKKSIDDLARTMSLNVGKVWLKTPEQEILVSCDEIKAGDEVIVHMGNVIPFDGIVTEGLATVNQASLTGESVPVEKAVDHAVFAGTVIEDGEITFKVKQTSGATKYEKIVNMIEDSEKLKSAAQSKAEHIADGLVPYTLAGTALTYLLTRNVTKALSILMVDFSCALKLAMPISVLSAINEAGRYDITVKGGKYLELMAEATTIVFDKTGTLTKAEPTVVSVIAEDDGMEEETLRVAACLEEHFPHSLAKAVVKAAKDRGLEHEEMHSKVQYIVAHGISSYIDDKKVIIGSYHFVMEDEGCFVSDEFKARIDSLPKENSYLYLGADGRLVAVIGIEDPVREEAVDVIEKLHKSGFDKIVMMTGDSDRTARAIAAKVGVDEYYSEVLPEDKARFVEEEKARGNKVIMIGDGINDSPALSAADVGIAISDGAELAREIADITIAADNLEDLLTLRELSKGLQRRISSNYRKIVAINGSLIALGVAGVIAPTTSATIHNASTVVIGIESSKKYLEK